MNVGSSEVTAIEERADGGADVFDPAQQAVMKTLSDDFDNFKKWYEERPTS